MSLTYYWNPSYLINLSVIFSKTFMYGCLKQILWPLRDLWVGLSSYCLLTPYALSRLSYNQQGYRDLSWGKLVLTSKRVYITQLDRYIMLATRGGLVVTKQLMWSTYFVQCLDAEVSTKLTTILCKTNSTQDLVSLPDYYWLLYTRKFIS